MDIERISRGFLTALRGERSQVQWSRRLGYSSNVAYAWESGRRWPTAAETLRAASRANVDVTAALSRFYAASPPAEDPTSPEAVARFLDDLRGSVPVADLARRAGLSRFRVARWLSAETQPRLPDFFRLVEASSVRLPDFVACFVDPLNVPGLASSWQRLLDARRGAASHPWTQALLRALELTDYAALPAHEPGWLATRLAIPRETEERCLSFLEQTDQIAWTGSHWQPRALTVDTRLDPDLSTALRRHWTGVAAERIAQGAPGQFSYNVVAVSRSDLERIRELHLAYFRAVRAIVAESSPSEVVAVINVQLFPLEPAAGVR